MKGNDLTSKTFKNSNGTEYVVLVGYENGEIVFVEKANPDAELYFACDAKIENSRLYSSYKVSYTVTKDEFFNAIKGVHPLEGLKRQYYKIPTVFLKPIVDLYLREKSGKYEQRILLYGQNYNDTWRCD